MKPPPATHLVEITSSHAALRNLTRTAAGA